MNCNSPDSEDAKAGRTQLYLLILERSASCDYAYSQLLQPGSGRSLSDRAGGGFRCEQLRSAGLSFSMGHRGRSWRCPAGRVYMAEASGAQRCFSGLHLNQSFKAWPLRLRASEVKPATHRRRRRRAQRERIDLLFSLRPLSRPQRLCGEPYLLLFNFQFGPLPSDCFSGSIDPGAYLRSLLPCAMRFRETNI